MWRIFGGAALGIAGVAVFIEAHSHHPRIGGLALLVVGALLIALGLIAYRAAQNRG